MNFYECMDFDANVSLSTCESTVIMADQYSKLQS